MLFCFSSILIQIQDDADFFKIGNAFKPSLDQRAPIVDDNKNPLSCNRMLLGNTQETTSENQENNVTFVASCTGHQQQPQSSQQLNLQPSVTTIRPMAEEPSSGQYSQQPAQTVSYGFYNIEPHTAIQDQSKNMIQSESQQLQKPFGSTVVFRQAQNVEKMPPNDMIETDRVSGFSNANVFKNNVTNDPLQQGSVNKRADYSSSQQQQVTLESSYKPSMLHQFQVGRSNFVQQPQMSVQPSLTQAQQDGRNIMEQNQDQMVVQQNALSQQNPIATVQTQQAQQPLLPIHIQQQTVQQAQVMPVQTQFLPQQIPMQQMQISGMQTTRHQLEQVSGVNHVTIPPTQPVISQQEMLASRSSKIKDGVMMSQHRDVSPDTAVILRVLKDGSILAESPRSNRKKIINPTIGSDHPVDLALDEYHTIHNLKHYDNQTTITGKQLLHVLDASRHSRLGNLIHRGPPPLSSSKETEFLLQKGETLTLQLSPKVDGGDPSSSGLVSASQPGPESQVYRFFAPAVGFCTHEKLEEGWQAKDMHNVLRPDREKRDIMNNPDARIISESAPYGDALSNRNFFPAQRFEKNQKDMPLSKMDPMIIWDKNTKSWIPLAKLYAQGGPGVLDLPDLIERINSTNLLPSLLKLGSSFLLLHFRI